MARCRPATNTKRGKCMRDSEEPLAVGDLLETEDGQLRICKYVGFEPAQWVLPEPKHHVQPDSVRQPAESSVS